MPVTPSTDEEREQGSRAARDPAIKLGHKNGHGLCFRGCLELRKPKGARTVL